ncbi:putative cytochrome C biogenesis membrane protein [Frankia canadensis]|uniref:Putative cytochrome C biogenesis membrane protein n=1 Tax=Frankia canadensis TaxID=1836972 RepID=A0A2I2KJP9_9ACTN|nr:cytochrome c biogenesis protein CcdA [Frankia canadensis]SNQ45874.1 putative cytochrome C biogenesis membrane protein [Frankia canadensis]SOU53164.1 putative cytochrome C biogenesis membrane protein [Frankia canadensis]
MSAVGLITDGPVLLAAPVAAAAGLLSFLSPCVLPLVPGYLTFVTGLSGEELEDRQRRGEPLTALDPSAGLDATPLTGTSATSALAGAPALAGASVSAGAMATVSMTDSSVTADCAGLAVGDGGSGDGGASRPASSAGGDRGGVTARLRRLWVGGRVAAGTGLFVLGFTLVFVSYGAAFGGLGRSLNRHPVGVGQVLGAFTIAMGLAFAGVFSRMSWANREWRIHRMPRPGLLGAPVLGMLFGLGWTPCLGPTLSAVQGLAVASATAERGAFLSAAYCLGLGLPFLVVGLAFRRAVGALRLLRRHARALTLAGGVMLVAVGVLQLTGEWAELITYLRPYAPGFSETPL